MINIPTLNYRRENNLLDFFFDDYAPFFFETKTNKLIEREILESDTEYKINFYLSGLNKENDVVLNFDNLSNKLHVQITRKSNVVDKTYQINTYLLFYLKYFYIIEII